MINEVAKLVVLSEQDERFPNERAVLDYFIYDLQWKGRKLGIRRLRIESDSLLFFQYQGLIIARAVAKQGKDKEIEIDRESIAIRRRRIAVCDLGVRVPRLGGHMNNPLNRPAPTGVHDLDVACVCNINEMCF